MTDQMALPLPPIPCQNTSLPPHTTTHSDHGTHASIHTCTYFSIRSCMYFHISSKYCIGRICYLNVLCTRLNTVYTSHTVCIHLKRTCVCVCKYVHERLSVREYVHHKKLRTIIYVFGFVIIYTLQKIMYTSQTVCIHLKRTCVCVCVCVCMFQYMHEHLSVREVPS